MRMRRPNSLPFNNWMGECLEFLERSSSLLDKRLAAWVRLTRIGEDASVSFGFDDPSTGVNVAEPRLNAIVKTFERRMGEWKKATSEEVIDGEFIHPDATLRPRRLICCSVSLTIGYYINEIVVYEFQMDLGKHDAEEYKQKFFHLPCLDDDGIKQEPKRSLTTAEVDASTKNISAAQSVLDAFFTIDSPTLVKIPNLLYVRALYALVVLLKASFAITDPNGLGAYVRAESLRARYYLETMVENINKALGTQRLRLPTKWLPIVTGLKEWYDRLQRRLDQKESLTRDMEPDAPISSLRYFESSTTELGQTGSPQDVSGATSQEYDSFAPMLDQRAGQQVWEYPTTKTLIKDEPRPYDPFPQQPPSMAALDFMSIDFSQETDMPFWSEGMG